MIFMFKMKWPHLTGTGELWATERTYECMIHSYAYQKERMCGVMGDRAPRICLYGTNLWFACKFYWIKCKLYILYN